ncbi:type II toxin-antitoxin system RelE/ParE family toxin [Blastochloris sulfoviridis]|uniref:Type II toxin-antitoxin system RelE/ParE family toxin n=1 Tax=Blastochloris sulfoviridis TaxID=50712 RepID=A0A5M6HUF0_9HYPH|nr:type II toxin-antitoxin system RelE/ParE family toxin [Blastochloris sulfoviridis]KAA5599179.1 type II toxin-antitoxin system RelE/ParE family toxin [Blastochloris sulfoviridis]
MPRRVVFDPIAERDLDDLYEYIADRSGIANATNFTDRLRAYCLSFDTFPHRGTKRDDLMPGLRTVGWHRRATIAFLVEPGRVLILRVLFRGRDPGASLFR